MSIESKLYNLFTWIKTFEVARDINSISEITDGLVIGHVLNFISPTDFTDQWLTRLSSEANESLEIKCLNLNYIVQAIVEFLTPITDRQLLVHLMPDVMGIVYHDNAEATFRLLQLVLGCAVNSESKKLHINNILCMQESVQHSLMEAIQQLMPSGTGAYENLSSPMEEYSSLLAKRDALAQRCHDLEYQVSQLRNEKALIESENQQLRTAGLSSDSSSLSATTTVAKLRAAALCIQLDDTPPEDIAVRVSRSDDELTPTIASVRISQLQDQVTKLNSALYQVESVKEEQCIRLSDLQSKNDGLKQKCEQLAKRAEEASHLKDELDIVREELSTAVQTSANLDNLRRRADEAGALRIRCSKLETDNAVCLERLAKLEQEARLSANLRSQIEKHRLELTELRQEAARARERADDKELELTQVKEELAAFTVEKTRLVFERNRRQSSSEDMQIYNVSSDNTTMAEEDGAYFKNLHEDMHQFTGSISSLDVTSQLGRPQRRDAVAWTGPYFASTDSEHDPATDGHVAHLEAQQAQRDEQLGQLEQRYRGYLWKAKEVIRLLDKQRRDLELQLAQRGATDTVTVSNDEVDRLRDLLVQKEATIERLEQYYEQTRRQRDLEERVVLSAWYNLATQILRESLLKDSEEDMSAGNLEAADESPNVRFPRAFHSKSSLLDRQREVHLKTTRGLTSIVMNSGHQ